MNAIGGEWGVETQSIGNRIEKERGQDAVKLIQSAAGGASSASLETPPTGRFPPPQPVKAQPREGSSIEVIA
ncbi:MAG: hypothetical protein QM767_05160 [Anaeromyxobacter sp.]